MDLNKAVMSLGVEVDQCRANARDSISDIKDYCGIDVLCGFMDKFMETDDPIQLFMGVMAISGFSQAMIDYHYHREFIKEEDG